MPAIATIRKTMKTEVDNNPMLKYILGSNQVSGTLAELKPNRNPIAQIDECSHNYNRNADWMRQMSKENIDLFKIQLSSLIK